MRSRTMILAVVVVTVPAEASAQSCANLTTYDFEHLKQSSS